MKKKKKDGVAASRKKKKPLLIVKGGPGSGHHGHRGRPGHRGGSLPRGSAGDTSESPKTEAPKESKFDAKKFREWASGLPLKTLKLAQKHLDKGVDNIDNVPGWLKAVLTLSAPHQVAWAAARKAKKIVDKLVAAAEAIGAFRARDHAKLSESLEKLSAEDLLDVCEKLGYSPQGAKRKTIEFLLEQALKKGQQKKSLPTGRIIIR